MDRIYPHFTVRTLLSFILLILFQTPAQANICSAPQSVDFAENNNVGDTVVTITVQPNVDLEFNPAPANPNNPFGFNGNQLIATRTLDYETERSHFVQITCTETTTALKVSLNIVVLVINVNDNSPEFAQELYNSEVTETAPIDTLVGTFAATDSDAHPQLYYTLTSPANEFRLRSLTIPDILVNAKLDYDKVNNVQLVLKAQDTPLTPPSEPSYTATTTIMITILDGDNRPPWFLPCTIRDVGGASICQNTGYTGRVVLNEQEAGVLPLKPAPVYAIDGDSGINEAIMYSFLSGNDDGLFAINSDTGNITMLKPTDVLGTISLTVLAAQKINTHQFSTTTVAISVQVKSLHPPQFQKAQYEGVISSVGAMAMDKTNTDQPLRIIATDQDYAGADGINPDITYSITGSSDFSIINGYLFMTKDLPEGKLSLEVMAVDSTNDESAKAVLSLDVKTGLTTTSLPESTTNFKTSTPTEKSTTDPGMSTASTISATSPTESTISRTSPGESTISRTSAISTTNSATSTDGSFSTTNPTLTPEGSFSTPSKAPTVLVPSGEYGVADMAALGATLGALLLICLVVIGVLAHRMQRGKADWRKIYETSVFRNSLGQGSGGQKEGIQYTNEAFENDEDRGSVGSGNSERKSIGEPPKPLWDIPINKDIERSSARLHDLLPDDTSDVGSDKTDSDKEVKPILTKERRVEEGYKSVWFREDIDPNAKEDVVIIPGNRADDSNDEDEEPSSSSREHNRDEKSSKRSKVLFTESDLDSGLGVKIEDHEDDSNSDGALNIDL